MLLTPNLLGSPGTPENAITCDGLIDLIGKPPEIAAALHRILEATP
jgi:hypothetical protein